MLSDRFEHETDIRASMKLEEILQKRSDLIGSEGHNKLKQ